MKLKNRVQSLWQTLFQKRLFKSAHGIQALEYPAKENWLNLFGFNQDRQFGILTCSFCPYQTSHTATMKRHVNVHIDLSEKYNFRK
ncbi:hypothetical protein JTE90_002894 [Oedothorax gibbosus]|uniref:BED-type domain-containing protein n=1 Tax=Oedothorax gibbosus TaxID=931172 RepID=A0AAV6VD83_9ARAC|nr:hypothetical protein JTE90_002894 [Oedothorax gibbosus]